ncbi:MAG: hypothetical protein ACO3RK_00165 [Luteolibacter sp.]
MIPFEHLKRRLAGVGRDRRWLSEQTGYSENTIRQYLGPKGKYTPDFLRHASEVIKREEAKLRSLDPDVSLWRMLFQSNNEFSKVDRASRIVKSESLDDFCRQSILERAEEILAANKKSSYRHEPGAFSKVAESPKPQKRQSQQSA